MSNAQETAPKDKDGETSEKHTPQDDPDKEKLDTPKGSGNEITPTELDRDIDSDIGGEFS